MAAMTAVERIFFTYPSREIPDRRNTGSKNSQDFIQMIMNADKAPLSVSIHLAAFKDAHATPYALASARQRLSNDRAARNYGDEQCERQA
jgi:hypothetical protein